MPFLIDGNNLMFALAGAGFEGNRSTLCDLLARLVAPRDRVCLVFDGPAPEGGISQQMYRPGVELIFSGRSSADRIILDRIAADSAPKRLTVVSTDHELRQAARRRRCRACRSEEFAKWLARQDRAPEQSCGPQEPPQKRAGLSEEETQAWLREFGIEDSPQDD
jgi:hypothetical protein